MIVITRYDGDQWNKYTRMGRRRKVHFLPVSLRASSPIWASEAGLARTPRGSFRSPK